MVKVLKYCAVTILLVLAGLWLAVLIPPNQAGLTAPRSPVAFQGVDIVDVAMGQIQPNKTVLISQGKITSIQNAESDVPEGYRVVSGKGRYLMPGLWDMHTHGLKLSPVLHHPLFIRHGVTAVRDMSGCLSQPDSYWACPTDRKKWTELSLAGETVSPRYVLQSSYQTNGGNEVPASYPKFFRLESKDHARQLVQFYAQQGADFIKTYTELSQQQLDWLRASTENSDLYLAGHKPLVVSLENAIHSGMKSIEHGRLFMFECYEDIQGFRAEPDPIANYNAQKMRDIINRQDNGLCEQRMTAMAQSNTYWVPTLTTLKMSAMARDETFREDPRRREIAFIVRQLLWEQDVNRAAKRGQDDHGEFVHQDYFRMASQQVNLAHQKGVKILAGTDNIDTYVFSGSSLHDELEMLAAAGISNVDVLRAATLSAAEFSGLDAQLGTIEVGKEADLVLLTGNPLQNIRNTRRIEGVMIHGHYFDHEHLAALESFAISSASSFRVNLRYLSDLLMSPLMRLQLVD